MHHSVWPSGPSSLHIGFDSRPLDRLGIRFVRSRSGAYPNRAFHWFPQL